MSSDAISPTAHYTAAVWARHGLSHPAFSTREGQVLEIAAWPLHVASSALGGPTIEGFLLARHRMIDRLLRAEIDAGRVGQVVELAAGMSPRGWRFASEYGDAIDYVEADLPAMAARKRAALEKAGTGGEHHRVVDVDALADDGPLSLAALAAGLDPSRGLAFVTEGLLNYFPREAVESLWTRMAGTLACFPRGRYFSDLHVTEGNDTILTRGFMAGLSTFVRGRVHLHYADVEEAAGALRAAGFTDAALHPGDPADAGGNPGADLVHVIDASV